MSLPGQASIDAVEDDLGSIARLFRSVTRDASSTISGPENTALRGSAFLIDRYLTQIVMPRLAAETVPSEDADALGTLAP